MAEVRTLEGNLVPILLLHLPSGHLKESTPVVRAEAAQSVHTNALIGVEFCTLDDLCVIPGGRIENQVVQ